MELRHYLDVMRRRRRLAALIVAVFVAAGALVTVLQPTRYEAETRVVLSVEPVLQGSPPAAGSSDVRTQVELMRSRPLLSKVAETLGMGQEGIPALERDLSVTVVGDTEMVSVLARAREPEHAKKMADAMAEEFSRWSDERSHRSSQRVVKGLVEQREEAREKMLELDAAGEGGSEFDAQREAAVRNYAMLSQELERIQVTDRAGSGVSAVGPAWLTSEEPVSPTPSRNLLLGLAFGVVFAVGGAFVVDHLDDTVTGEEDLEALVGAPVLGRIPWRRNQGGHERLAQPGSSASEAYRVLRGSLGFVNFRKDVRSLLVTSPSPSEGKSSVAANLADGLARAGERTVLVCADMRGEGAESILGSSASPGLSELLSGQASLQAVLHRGSTENLVVVPPGRVPPNPAEMLESQRMRQLLTELEARSEWVVIDTPPVLAVSDAAALAPAADGVLLVMRQGSTRRSSVRRAAEVLGQVGSKVLGNVVLVVEKRETENSYGTSYGRTAAVER